MTKVIINGVEYIPKETWTDPDTGLIWESQETDKRMSWKKALEYTETLGDNWRLPTVQELITLIDFSKINPACKIANTHCSYYWSSTTYAYGTYSAWYVSFGNGGVSYGNKSGSYYVRCVKGEKK